MPPAAPEDRRRARLLAALCFMSAVGPLATFLYLPALPDVARVFGTTEAGAQATLTALMAGNCMGYALLGRANDRFGQRRVFAASMLVFVAASLLAAVAPDLSTLVVTRLLQGVGGSVGVITARSIVRQTFPGRGGQGLAILSAVGGIAPAASPLIGALVLMVGDWRLTFLVTAVLGALALAVSLRVLPREDRVRRPDPPSGGMLRAFLAHPEIRAGVVMGILHNGIFTITMAGSPFVFVAFFGWSPLAYGLLVGVMLSTFSAASLWSGRAFTRHGLRRVMGWGLPGVAAGALLQLGGILTHSGVPVAVGLTILMGSLGPVVPGNHMRLLDPFPELAGSVVGASMLTITGSGVALLWLYGLTAGGGIGAYGVWICVLALLTVLCWVASPPLRGGLED